MVKFLDENEQSKMVLKILLEEPIFPQAVDCKPMKFFTGLIESMLFLNNFVTILFKSGYKDPIEIIKHYHLFHGLFIESTINEDTLQYNALI